MIKMYFPRVLSELRTLKVVFTTSIPAAPFIELFVLILKYRGIFAVVTVKRNSRWTRIDYKHFKSVWNLVMNGIFVSLGEKFEEKLAFKKCKISDLQKRSLVHTFVIKKSIQCIGLQFLEAVNRGVPFQESELTNVFVAQSETVSLMLIRQIL